MPTNCATNFKKATKLVAILATLALGACTTMGNPPKVYDEVFLEVNRAHTYQNYAKKDYTPMQPGEGGNCARFAGTYQQALAIRGIKSDTAQCVLKNGTNHAFTITEDGWVLDVRQRWAVSFENVGCQIPG